MSLLDGFVKKYEERYTQTEGVFIMKKFASLFLVLSLMLTWHLPGKETAQVAAHVVAEQGIDLDDDDGYLLLDCQLSPIKRKSKSTGRGGSHPNYVGSAEKHSASESSLNWSGYVAFTGKKNHPDPTFGSVTEASGSWIVPKLTASHEGDTYSAAWVGIDGFANSVVEQIGTEHDVINGHPVYYAWFEMFPADSQLIEGFPVHKGDKIEGKVTYEGQDSATNDLFRLVIKNHTRKVKFVVYQSTLPGHPAHLSSANWIVEAPATVVSNDCLGFLPLADFRTIFFNDCHATINGETGTIGNEHWTHTSISMVSTGGVVKDIPSDLCHNKKSKCKKDAFSVLWKNTGPFPYDLFCDN